MATRKTPEKKPAPVKPAKDTVPPGKAKDNAGKKTPPKITSEIVIEAAKKIALNPKNPAKAAALSVIYQLAKMAKQLPKRNYEIEEFLDTAYASVMKGGGSDGGNGADPFPPAEPAS